MVLGRVLVTGATGMVGRAMVSALRGEGIAVVGSGRRAPDTMPSGVDWAIHDLREWREPEAFDALFGKVDHVFHAGAPVPVTPDALSDQELMNAGPRGCLALASWARARGAGFQFVSGALVYRDQETRGLTEDAPVGQPDGPWRAYAASKIMSEQAIESLIRPDWAPAILRATSVYGIGLPAGKLIPRWLETARAGGEIRLSPPADDAVNMVHADDVAQAAILAAKAGATGIYNIAGHETVTMERLAKACVSAVGRGELVIESGEADREPTRRFDVNGAKAARDFGYRPIISIDQGIAALANAEAEPA